MYHVANVVRRVSSAVFLAAALLAHPAPARSQTSSQPSLAISLNERMFRQGATLNLGVRLTNPGGGPVCDFFLVIVLPDGARAVSIRQGAPVFGSTSNLQSLVPFASAVSLQAPLTVDRHLFSHTFDGNEPQGTYRVNFVALTAGALGNGVVDPGELVAWTVETFSFAPGFGDPPGRLRLSWGVSGPGLSQSRTLDRAGFDLAPPSLAFPSAVVRQLTARVVRTDYEPMGFSLAVDHGVTLESSPPFGAASIMTYQIGSFRAPRDASVLIDGILNGSAYNWLTVIEQGITIVEVGRDVRRTMEIRAGMNYTFFVAVSETSFNAGEIRLRAVLSFSNLTPAEVALGAGDTSGAVEDSHPENAAMLERHATLPVGYGRCATRAACSARRWTSSVRPVSRRLRHDHRLRRRWPHSRRAELFDTTADVCPGNLSRLRTSADARAVWRSASPLL